MIKSARLAVCIVAASCTLALAGGNGEELCDSPDFREAFLEGQTGVLIDETSPSPRLVGLGDHAVPCLVTIVRDGGRAFGIEGCLETTEQCRTWALAALRRIGTPSARDALRAYAVDTSAERLQALAIQALGSLHDEESRPLLLDALKSGRPSVRAEALIALGVQQRREDRDILAVAFEQLPDDRLYRGLYGLRFHGDVALEPGARERVERVGDKEKRASLLQSLAAWRLEREEEELLLEKLRSPGNAEELFLTMRDTRRPSASVAEATERWLAHPDARVRAGAVALLARATERNVTVTELLTVAEELPDVYVAIAARDLLAIPDATVYSRLTKRAQRMENVARQKELEKILGRHKAAARPD